MTVRELTKTLALIPEEYQDLKIIDSSYEIIRGYWRLCPDYPLGDYANPNCKYEDVIYIE